MTTTTTSDLIGLADVRVRPAIRDDLGYVIDTWGRSLRGEYPDARTTDFVDCVKRGIDRRLAAGARIFVAHPEADPTLILGWSCGRHPIVHYVYVREAYRRLGLARVLVSCIVVVVSGAIPVDAMTEDLRAIRRTHRDQIRYLPNP